jgi:hypothetical protein
MTADYYILWYRLDGLDKFLIWYTNDEDGVVLRDGMMPVFSRQDDLHRYAAAQGITIKKEQPRLHDLDVVAKWIMCLSPEAIDCNEFNAAWNLFADVSEKTNSIFDKEKKLTKKIYNKLFWGMNLPSVTPNGKEYDPFWTKAEVKILHDVMTKGLDLFRATSYEL